MINLSNYMDSTINITPEEAYHITIGTKLLPGGTWDFLDGVAKMYRAKPITQENFANLLFMMSTVFIAGIYYAAGQMEDKKQRKGEKG